MFHQHIRGLIKLINDVKELTFRYIKLVQLNILAMQLNLILFFNVNKIFDYETTSFHFHKSFIRCRVLYRGAKLQNDAERDICGQC